MNDGARIGHERRVPRFILASIVFLSCPPPSPCVDGGCGGGMVIGVGVGGGPGGFASAGGTSGGTSGGAPGEDCVRFAQALCANNVRCGGFEGTRQADCVAATVAACRARNESVALGTSRVSLQTTNACLDALSSTCSTELSRYGCGAQWEPLSREGDRCLVSADCRAPFVCDGVPCQRTCRRPGALGAPCVVTTFGARVCDATLRCDSTDERCREGGPVGASCDGDQPCDVATAWCDQGQCRALPASGEPCLALAPSCSRAAQCENGRCTARLERGATCLSNEQCAWNLTCRGFVCADRLGPGEACDVEPSEPLQCRRDLRCDTTWRTCQSYAVAFEGEPCSDDAVVCGPALKCTAGRCANGPCDGHEDCPVGTGCVAGACRAAGPSSPCLRGRNCRATDFCFGGTCLPRVGLGAACDSSRGDSCADGAFCLSVGGSSTCQRLHMAGAACTAGVPFSGCAGGLSCEGGVCELAGRRGERCQSGGACSSGACSVVGGPGVCGAERPVGAPCLVSSECETGACDPITLACRAACP